MWCSFRSSFGLFVRSKDLPNVYLLIADFWANYSIFIWNTFNFPDFHNTVVCSKNAYGNFKCPWHSIRLLHSGKASDTEGCLHFFDMFCTQIAFLPLTKWKLMFPLFLLSVVRNVEHILQPSLSILFRFTRGRISAVQSTEKQFGIIVKCNSRMGIEYSVIWKA